MENTSGIIDFSGLKITFPKVYEEDNFVCYTDKNMALYSKIPKDFCPIFFLSNGMICTCSENISVICRPESVIFKTGNLRLYYTFLGSCFIFSTDKSFLNLFDISGKNTVCIPPDSYGKFTRNGLTVY